MSVQGYIGQNNKKMIYLYVEKTLFRHDISDDTLKTNHGGNIMPIITISGLAASEELKKLAIRQSIKEYFFSTRKIDLQDTSVRFLFDDTVGEDEHVFIEYQSQHLGDLNEDGLKEISKKLHRIVSNIAQHPFHEAYNVPVRAMYGAPYNQTS